MIEMIENRKYTSQIPKHKVRVSNLSPQKTKVAEKNVNANYHTQK